MKQSKLLLTSALVGSVAFAGSALAEISGDITNTINFGSDEGASGATGSDQRIGSETNIKYKAKKELNNGLIAGLSGKLEFDDGTSDQEYEMTLGTDTFYVGVGNDGGNSIRSSALPFLGYVPGTLAEHVGPYTTHAYDLLGEAEAADIDHISVNAKAAGGTFTIRYAPQESASDDTDFVTSSASTTAEGRGSRTEMVYRGSPVEGLKVIIGMNKVQDADDTTNSDEEEVKKFGASYNFGQFSVGAELQQMEHENNTNSGVGSDRDQTEIAASFAASDNITIGLTYTEVSDETAASTAPDEEIVTLNVGYNLGGMNIIASYVDATDIGNVANQDASGLVIRTQMGF